MLLLCWSWSVSVLDFNLYFCLLVLIRDGNCTPMGVYTPQTALLCAPPKAVYAPPVFALFFTFLPFLRLPRTILSFSERRVLSPDERYALPSLFNLLWEAVYSSAQAFMEEERGYERENRIGWYNFHKMTEFVDRSRPFSDEGCRYSWNWSWMDTEEEVDGKKYRYGLYLLSSMTKDSLRVCFATIAALTTLIVVLVHWGSTSKVQHIVSELQLRRTMLQYQVCCSFEYLLYVCDRLANYLVIPINHWELTKGPHI